MKTFSSWKEFIDFELSKFNFYTNHLINRLILSKSDDDNESTIKLEQSYDSVSEKDLVQQWNYKYIYY